MRYTALIIFAFIGSMLAQANLEIIDGSFKSLSDGNVALSDNDMGKLNMTSKMIDFKTDANGDDRNALLVVYFENMDPSDIAKVVIPRLSNNEPLIAPETHNMEGQTTRWFYIPEARDFDIDFSHPRLGITRLSGITMERHKIYILRLRASGTVSVNITSQPAGADVYFDTRRVGKTPLTLSDVPFGSHSISLTSPDSKIANSLSATSVVVSADKANFDYNLMKRRDIILTANPSSASLQLVKDGRQIAYGQGQLKAVGIEYGTYKVIGKVAGEYNETTLEVNSNTPSVSEISVVPSRNINFVARQNNAIVKAQVSLDGEMIGSTPMTTRVNYGTHYVDMSYYGYSKGKKFKVDKNTDNKVELILPNRHRERHNPFDIDYEKREWGFSINYVNRSYRYREGSQSETYNFWLEEGHESGFQTGISYQPYFGYGQGLSTGIYWQMVINDIDDMTYMEHSFFIPLLYQFRLPLASNFSIFANGGVGVNIGLKHEVTLDDNDENAMDLGYGHNDEFDVYFPGRYDFSWIVGGGIQYKCVQLEARWINGITDHSHIYDCLDGVKQSFKQNTWTVGISFMF